MYRPVTTVSMARLMVSHLKRPQPYARLGHTHSLTYKVGASSLLKYKYPPVPRRRLGHTAASTLSDHDLKAIQDTLEGLRLMSLLKYVHLPTIPSSCSTLHCPSAAPPSPNSHFPPNPGLTLDRVVSHSSRRSIHRRSRSAFSRTVVSPLARPTSLRIRRRIQVPIMSSQSIRLTNPHVPLVKHRFLPSLPFPSLPPTSPASRLGSFERLEHVGDQVLGLIATDLLQSQFPHLRVGPSTVRMLQRLISLPISVSDSGILFCCRKCERSSLAI